MFVILDLRVLLPSRVGSQALICLVLKYECLYTFISVV